MTSPALNPEKALIFRITHRENIPWILDHGLHARNGAQTDPNFRNIGNLDLINKRPTRRVTVGSGGTLSDYIPFYFTPFSMMMYNIHTGRNVPIVPNAEIVILVSSLLRISRLGIPFVFTDRHAYLKTASYFTEQADLSKLAWDLWKNRDFVHDSDHPEKTDRYQAEALIWKHLSVEALLGICCSSNDVDDWLKFEIQRRNLTLRSDVQKGWYFS